MKVVINIIFSIANVFILPFVGYKIYNWYSPHVGFNLPELSYVNVFAIMFIISATQIGNFSSLSLEMNNKEDKDDKLNHVAVSKSVLYFLTLGISYLLYLVMY